MEAIIGKILSDLVTFLFGPIMLAVFFGVGLYFTIRLKGIQFTRFGTAFQEVVWNVEKKSDEDIGQIRSYKALASTVLGWYTYGESAFVFLFGTHKVKIYRGLHMVICALGALISVQLLWDAADVCNGLMAIPNLFSLILFGGIVVKDTKDFFADYDHALSKGKTK